QEIRIDVPRLDSDKVSTSSLVLADQLGTVPTRSIGTGQFVIGSSKVRPRIDSTFKREEKMGIFLKVYNLGADENTHKPDGQVQYVLTKNGSNERLFEFTEEISQIPNASASQMTIQQVLPLNTLAPGQ